jgi:hypothetical protein
MVVDWRGDNGGPPVNVEEVLNDWYHLSEQCMLSLFSGFKVIIDSFL